MGFLFFGSTVPRITGNLCPCVQLLAPVSPFLKSRKKQLMLTLVALRKRERLTETWTDSDLNAWWAKQIEWKKAEQDFHQWYRCSFPVGRSLESDEKVEDLAPFVRLDRFPNLRNVETVGCWNKNYRDSHPGLHYWQTKEWQDLEQEGTAGLYEFNPNRCLEMFCLQLEHSRKEISSLRVTYLCEILDEPGRGFNLANFPTLTIDLATSADYALRAIEDDEFPHPDGNFSDWFQSAARKLKNLNIIQCWITEKNKVEPLDALVPALDIFRLLNFRNLTFPTLQTLYLQHVTTTASSLTEFLNRHRKTLISLTIVRPCIDPEDWNEMRQRIEDEVEQGYYGPESGCEIVLTDAMTDPMGNDKDWKAFDSLIQFQ